MKSDLENYTLEKMIYHSLNEKVSSENNQWEYSPKKYVNNYSIERRLTGKLPPLLVFRLKRYTNHFDAVSKKAQQKKIEDDISINPTEILNLAPFYINQSSLAQAPLYHLKSIVIHNGKTGVSSEFGL